MYLHAECTTTRLEDRRAAFSDSPPNRKKVLAQVDRALGCAFDSAVLSRRGPGYGWTEPMRRATRFPLPLYPDWTVVEPGGSRSSRRPTLLTQGGDAVLVSQCLAEATGGMLRIPHATRPAEISADTGAGDSATHRRLLLKPPGTFFPNHAQIVESVTVPESQDCSLLGSRCELA